MLILTGTMFWIVATLLAVILVLGCLVAYYYSLSERAESGLTKWRNDAMKWTGRAIKYKELIVELEADRDAAVKALTGVPNTQATATVTTNET